MEWDCSLFNPQFWCSCWSLVLLHCSRFPVNKRPCWVAKFFPVRKSNPGLLDESHKSSLLDQLGVFTYQSLTLIRILVVCSVTMNRFQCNESQCLTPKSPSPGVEPGTWGWGPQILIYFINRHCSPPKCFPVRELIPGLEGGVLRVKSANPNSMYRLTLLLSKTFNTTGVEPGTCGWKPRILTARPTGSVHY